MKQEVHAYPVFRFLCLVLIFLLFHNLMLQNSFLQVLSINSCTNMFFDANRYTIACEGIFFFSFFSFFIFYFLFFYIYLHIPLSSTLNALSVKRGFSKSIFQLVFSEVSTSEVFTVLASSVWKFAFSLISTRSLALPHSTAYKPIITLTPPIKLKKSTLVYFRYLKLTYQSIDKLPRKHIQLPKKYEWKIQVVIIIVVKCTNIMCAKC